MLFGWVRDGVDVASILKRLVTAVDSLVVIVLHCFCEQSNSNHLHAHSPLTGRDVHKRQKWELRPIDGDDGALNLELYTDEELTAILDETLNEIGVGGFSSVFRGQLPDSGVTVAVKCPRKDRSVAGVLETLSKELGHRQ